MTVDGSEGRARGRLILIGGAEDKFDDKVILQQVVSAGSSERVVVIPTASDFPVEVSDRYRRAFSALGVTRVDTLDIRRTKEADKPKFLEAVSSADAVFFSGGDQVKLVKTLEGSQLLSLIRSRHGEGMTIAGTSAGAAAASDTMIYDGDDEGHAKGTIRHREGFAFVKRLTVDSHFLVRCRISRLVQVIAAGLAPRGIGLAEDTAVDLGPDDTFTVVGSGVVVLLNGELLDHSDYDRVAPGEPFTVDGIRLSLLAAGSRFDLSRWEVIPSARVEERVPSTVEGCSSTTGRANE